MDLLMPTLRFSDPLPPREPRHYRWPLAAPEDSAVTLRCFPETLVTFAFAIPYHRYIHMDNDLRVSFIQSFAIALDDYKLPQYYSLFRESLCFRFAASFALRIIPDIYRGSVQPHLLMCFSNNANRSFENPMQSIALESLACLHYG